MTPLIRADWNHQIARPLTIQHLLGPGGYCVSSTQSYVVSIAASAASALAFVLLSAGAVWASGPTGLLNDTGQTTCYDGTSMVACTVVNTGDAATYPRQDGRFGRDVANVTKVGGGAAGFDFTKVCMDGTLNCIGAANTGASPVATEWACTKDNVTNLVWSLQTRSANWNTASAVNYPDVGHNSATRCGYGDGWRMPTRRELMGIAHYGITTSPIIDTEYFPSTISSYYLASETYAPSPNYAWVVLFGNGNVSSPPLKTSTFYVRLVRSGQ